MTQNLRYEAEWVSTNIISILELVSTDKFYHQKNKQLNSLKSIINLRPHVIKSSIFEIPKHWKNEQLLQSARFQSDQTARLSHSLKLPQLQHSQQNKSRSHNDENIFNGYSSGAIGETQISSLKQTFSKSSLAKSSQRSYTDYDGSHIDEQKKKKDLIDRYSKNWISESLSILKLTDTETSHLKRLRRLILQCHQANSIAYLQEEKNLVKSKLKAFDEEFHQHFKRSPTRDEKEPLRSLYIYYRRVKLSIEHCKKSLKESSNITQEQSHTNKIEERTVAEPSPGIVHDTKCNNSRMINGSKNYDKSRDERFINENSAYLSKLLKEKAIIRKKLQNFQKQFYEREGRLLKYHRDIVSVESEYRQYKALSEKINAMTT